MKTKRLFFVTVMLIGWATLFISKSALAFSIGNKVQCTQDLNVRSSYSTSATLITSETAGSQGTISSGPQVGSGYTWWYINWGDGYSGWSVQDYLSVVTAIAPSATTNTASNVTSNSAQLNATINPNGSSTSAYFQYGTTTAYGGTTGSGNFGNGTSSIAIQSIDSGLNSNTLFHYRVVASNSGGTTYGNDVTFTTSGLPAPSISSVSPAAR